MFRFSVKNLVLGLAAFSCFSAISGKSANAQDAGREAYIQTYLAYVDANGRAGVTEDQFQSGGWRFHNDRYWAGQVKDFTLDALIHAYYANYYSMRNQWMSAVEDLDDALNCVEILLMCAQDSQPQSHIRLIEDLEVKLRDARAMCYTAYWSGGLIPQF